MPGEKSGQPIRLGRGIGGGPGTLVEPRTDPGTEDHSGRTGWQMDAAQPESRGADGAVARGLPRGTGGDYRHECAAGQGERGEDAEQPSVGQRPARFRVAKTR